MDHADTGRPCGATADVGAAVLCGGSRASAIFAGLAISEQQTGHRNVRDSLFRAKHGRQAPGREQARAKKAHEGEEGGDGGHRSGQDASRRDHSWQEPCACWH